MATIRHVDEIFLRRAVEIVLTHLDQHEFSGNELAAELNLSREQTHRKLKRYSGVPTGKFVCYLRLLKAYGLLFANGYTVSEISYKVGFESPSYFNKCFKEAFGVPPGDIRRNGKRF